MSAGQAGQLTVWIILVLVVLSAIWGKEIRLWVEEQKDEWDHRHELKESQARFNEYFGDRDEKAAAGRPRLLKTEAETRSNVSASKQSIVPLRRIKGSR